MVDTKPKTNVADVDSTTDADADADTRDADADEKQAWKTTAAAKGVVLKGVDLKDSDDMKELYGMLNVTGVGPRSRLRALIKSLQEGKLRCCFRIHCAGVLIFVF